MCKVHQVQSSISSCNDVDSTSGFVRIWVNNSILHLSKGVELGKLLQTEDTCAIVNAVVCCNRRCCCCLGPNVSVIVDEEVDSSRFCFCAWYSGEISTDLDSLVRQLSEREYACKRSQSRVCLNKIA